MLFPEDACRSCRIADEAAQVRIPARLDQDLCSIADLRVNLSKLEDVALATSGGMSCTSSR